MGIKVKFSNKFLNDLVQDSDSGIVLEANRTKYVNVSPFQLQSLTGFIKEYLDSLVATYDPELSGIILSHQKLKINPQFNVQGDGTNKLLYIADIYVFRPKIGSVLTGVVNQKSKDHVGCLVHRVFNVTIPKPDGEEEAVWNSTSVGQDVRFRVVAFDMTLKIPSIHGKILDPSSPQPSNAMELDVCLQEALDNHCENESMKSDSENDDLSDSGGVKTQKPKFVQGNTEKTNKNRLNESNLIEDNLQNDEVTNRTSLSPRKSVDASKNKRSSISLSIRKLKDVHGEIDSDNFIPPSPVRALDKSINKEDSFEKSKEETERSNYNFEKTEEDKRTFNVSTSNITFRTRKNNLWVNDETFGNVSSFLKNSDSPQSCLRSSVSPSSSTNSPGNSEKRNRSVRFSTHDSVLTFGSNIESLNESKNINREVSKSPQNVSDSFKNLESGESIEKKLSETMKSCARATSSTTILESNEKSDDNLGKKLSANRESHEKQTIISNFFEKSRNIVEDSKSDSNSDDSFEENDKDSRTKIRKSPGIEGESSTNWESLKNTSVNTDSDSSFDENLERKDKLKDLSSSRKDGKLSKNSGTHENSSGDSDSGEKIERRDKKSPKDIKLHEKDVETSKHSLTPRSGSVNYVPVSQIDDSFDSRRKMFLENTKSPEKRGKNSINSETTGKFREKLNFDKNLERRKSVDSLDASKNDGSAIFSDHREGSGKIKRKSNEKESGKRMDDDSENEVAQEIIPEETDSLNKSRIYKIERNDDTTKSPSTSVSSTKNKQFTSVFNLADETPKRMRRDSEKHDKNVEMRRVSGIESRIKDVESGNIIHENKDLLKSSSKSPVSGNKVHESMERNRMLTKGIQKKSEGLEGTDFRKKVNERNNDDDLKKDGSPEKTIRERTASICEESTVTMLLKNAYSKFWGSKNRKSIETKVDSVDASTVEDSNQDTDLEQVTKKSGKIKRKSIETLASSIEIDVNNDGGKQLNQDTDLEKMTKKSGEKKRKSIESNVNSVGNYGAISSNQENYNKIEIQENRNLSLQESNQEIDSEKISKKAKKKKSKEKELDKRKPIELCVEREDKDQENTIQANRNCSVIDLHQDTDVEKLSKKARKKKNKEKERELVEIQLQENRNLSLQESNQEIDVEKISKKAKKKRNKEKELDDGKTENLCVEKKDEYHKIINRNSSVLNLNEGIEVTRKIKKKKKHKEKVQDDRELIKPDTAENEEVVLMESKNLPVIDVGNQEMNVEELSKKAKKKKKKNGERDLEDVNEEDIKRNSKDLNQDTDVEKLSKKVKKNKEKEIEDGNQGHLDRSSFLHDSNHELDVRKLSKKEKKKNKELNSRKSVESYFTNEEGENKMNEKRNKFNLDVANWSTVDGYITDHNSSRHKTKKKSNFKMKCEGYSSEIDFQNQERASDLIGGDGSSKKKHKSEKYFESLLSSSVGDELIVNKERRSSIYDENDDNFEQDQQKEKHKKFRKRKDKDNREKIEDSSLLTNQTEGSRQQSIDLDKKEDSFHKKKHRNSSGLEGALGLVNSPKQFSIDGYITDYQYSKLESKKKSSFKTKRDGYASDFEAKKRDGSTKIDEDLKRKHKLKKYSDIGDQNMTGITGLDGYITDCQSSRHKSKEKSSFKLKRDGYASDFETSLRIPVREEVMMKKNKHMEKKSTVASKISNENEARIIENVSANQDSTTHKIDSYKSSRKRKKSDMGKEAEKNDDPCIPTKRIKVMESSHVSELEINENKTEPDGTNENTIISEQQELPESFKEGGGSTKRKRKRKKKMKKSIITLENSLSKVIEVDREESTEKKKKESKNQDINPLDISRKRKISDIVEDVDSNLIPTKKIKTMQSSSHELEIVIDESRKKRNKNEQNLTLIKKHQKLQSCEPVKDDEKSGMTKSRKSKDSSLEMCKAIDKTSLEESSKKKKGSRKSITNEEFPINSRRDGAGDSEPANDSKVRDSTSNRLLATVEESETPKKSAEKTSRRKTPNKSIEDPNQKKMLKYFNPLEKIQPTQGISDNTDNLGQSSNSAVSSNPSNLSSAETIDCKVKKVLNFSAETVGTEKERKTVEIGEKTSKKKKKKRKSDDILELQQEMINRLLKNKSS